MLLMNAIGMISLIRPFIIIYIYIKHTTNSSDAEKGGEKKKHSLNCDTCLSLVIHSNSFYFILFYLSVVATACSNVTTLNGHQLLTDFSELTLAQRVLPRRQKLYDLGRSQSRKRLQRSRRPILSICDMHNAPGTIRKMNGMSELEILKLIITSTDQITFL